MKLTTKDVSDLQQVIYWLAAVKADLQAIDPELLPQDRAECLIAAVDHLEKADNCACRVLTGENRNPDEVVRARRLYCNEVVMMTRRQMEESDIVYVEV